MTRAGPILLYVVGIAFFCAMDALMKALVVGSGNDAVMATFWRYVAAVGFILAFWWREGRPAITRSMLPVQLWRGVAITISALAFFWSFTVLPLAEAVTIAFVAPLLIPPLAAVMLGERMQSGSVAAGLVGFLGVVVAVGFDPRALSSERLSGVAAVLVAAAAYALATVLTRKVAARDGPSILSLMGALVPIALLGPLMLATVPSGDWLPRRADLALFVAVGLAGAVALQFIGRAYARAEAQVLAPFEYTALLWAAGLGWFVFGEPVSLRTWAGAAIIILACLWQAGLLKGRRPAVEGQP